MAANEFIYPPVVTVPEELVAEAYDFIASRVPGWEPSDTNLEAALAEAFCRALAESTDVLADVPVSIFRWFGATIMGILPQDATPATAKSTWTMVDDDGYTIPEGTVVGVEKSGDVLIAFEVVFSVTVSPGNTATADGEVELVALIEGAEGSGLDGDVTLNEGLDFIADDGIVLEGITTGGEDAESDQQYLNRLTSELSLMSPRPILARDFAILYERLAGVERATAVDNYNPADDTYDNEKMVAVAGVDELGNAVDSTTKAEAEAMLEAMREVNFIVNVIDPTYTEFDVTYTAVAEPGWDAADVEARADQAVEVYLTPSRWGIPQSSTDGVGWNNTTVMRYLELAQVINFVEGLDYIVSLTFGEAGGALASSNVTLDGAIPLPTPGTINGTVNAP